MARKLKIARPVFNTGKYTVYETTKKQSSAMTALTGYTRTTDKIFKLPSKMKVVNRQKKSAGGKGG